jgi:hypothetical protein
MIAAVKGCHAILPALLFLILPAAEAADDVSGAARELARRSAVYGRLDASAVTWRNISSLGSAELAQARTAFEAALEEFGNRNPSAPQVVARITLSQNPTKYLLVEEAQIGEEREVWIASWKRVGAARQWAPGMSLESKLALEQDEQILDLAFVGSGMLVLSPSKVTLRAASGAQSVDLAAPKPWPRDLRGRLRVAGNTFQAFLPGMTCAGSAAPTLKMDCHAGEPWVLESGSRAILLANFAPRRNYFDGRVVTQAGVRKTIDPFFSAAAVEETGRTVWVLAMLDGRDQTFDAALDPQGKGFTLWGSEITALDGRCGTASPVLATRPGDGSEPDAVQAFALAGGAAVPLTAPVTFAGPVTALWPAGASSALAVARDLSTGKYGAYVLTVSCGM